MTPFAPLIAAVVGVVAGDEQARSVVGQYLEQLRQAGGEWTGLAAAIKRLIAGERDAEALCEGLGPNPAMLIKTSLQALDAPSVLDSLASGGDAGQ